MQKIGLLITGNELLSGKIKDSNGAYVGAALRKIGLSITSILICADDNQELQNSLAFLAERCDIVVTSGGLGPTSDDLTAEFIASFFNFPLAFNEAAWNNCLDYFKRMGRENIPESNKKQANLPHKCDLLYNKIGTAAGFSVNGVKNNKLFQTFSLPGVPKEFELMFDEFVLPLLMPNSRHINKYTWQVFSLGESAMQTGLVEVEKQLAERFENSIISYQAHYSYATYEISIQSENAELGKSNQELFKGCIEPSIDDVLSGYILYKDPQLLSPWLISGCVELNLKLGFAESCTGGLIASLISQIPGASRAFSGSIVAYQNEVKSRLLNVSDVTLIENGAESVKTASEMAHGSMLALNCDISLAVTGFAGPGGGTEMVPVGTVFFAISLSEKALTFLNRNRFKNLELFGWQDTSALCGSSGLILSSKQFYGSGLSRQVVQLRAANFGLGSIAMLFGYN